MVKTKKTIEQELGEELQKAGYKVTFKKELKETLRLIYSEFWLFKVIKWTGRVIHNLTTNHSKKFQN